MSGLERRARTPEQKRAIIERLLALWLAHPTQRLGQVLENYTQGPPFFIEDDDLIEMIERNASERTK